MATKKNLAEVLEFHDDIADDFDALRDRIMPGSCEWILRHSAFLAWRDAVGSHSEILWLTGLPAVGKSMLSSSIVDALARDPTVKNYAYYFFKSGDCTKKSIGQMVRSLAFQTALSCQTYRDNLLELYGSSSVSSSRQKVSTLWETIIEGILCRQVHHDPFFWVIDGLDEADHPGILVKLLTRLRSINCFRILIVSRPMRETALTCGNGSGIKVVHDEISLTDTFGDIKAYATSAISSILQADRVQDDVCARLLEKAHGSFLWVTLALKQLRNNWHTGDDIDRILNDLPGGMESLYERMVRIISEQEPRPRAIALRILTWTVCASRPLNLEELRVALFPEFGNFVSLKDTIAQICGNIVVVEKSRVFLIHDTAREFLLRKTAGKQPIIDHSCGNESIALACINFLMRSSKGWKRTLAQVQISLSTETRQRPERVESLIDEHPFLSYAVTCWAYHISVSPTQSDAISVVLEFLETSCLLWIHVVAVLGDMRTLARTSQYLKLYIKKRNRKGSNDSLISLVRNRDDELKQWAKDLTRVVGRFAKPLTLNPQSIHRSIIPFCPTASVINQTYGHTSGLSVIGLSNPTWDDCLARLTVGNDQYASKVLCKGHFFTILLWNGTLLVWHAESCEEVRRLEHGEWVSALECSKASSLVATAGTKTIRVWDISTGDEVSHIPKGCDPSECDRGILALSFGIRDDEILIGYDDATIVCVDLATSMVRWNLSLRDHGGLEYLCPNLIAFSPDNSQVLVGYRGRPLLTWNMESPGQGPQACILPEDRLFMEDDNRRSSTPERVVWRPELPVALIIYNDATMIEWNIDDDTQRQIPGIQPREMALSEDGNLLLTSDYSGTLSVWTVPEYRLTYQVRANGVVYSLAFSPDGQRFYDVRGSLWEPDALARPDDLDREELSSAQDTLFSETPPSANDVQRPDITAVVCDAEDEFYCCGKDSGAVVLHNMRTGEKVRKVYGHSAVASVVEMAWSVSSKFVASADDCGRVISKRLRKPTTQVSTWAVYPLLDFRPGEAVSQLLFSSTEEYLLVSSAYCDWVWSLKDKQEICRSEHAQQRGRHWMNHPTIADRLVCVDSERARIFDWCTLKEVDMLNTADGVATDIDLSTPSRSVPADDFISIERSVLVKPGHIIFEINRMPRSKDTIAHIDILSQNSDTKLQVKPIDDISGKFNHLIGMFQGHIVFLDHQYRFCTWDWQKGASSLKQHFFLPKDWLSPGMLRLCIMNDYGTILCPKNGEVAIIRSGIKL